ncbi:fibronectin type III domain-containing protein [Longibacter salinarum]|nr:hypothetical protein [Longibacter salinarum]
MASPARAQQPTQAAEAIVQGQARTDGSVWVYHTEMLPLGYGFNIYRDVGDGFVKLNEEPIFGATSGAELTQNMDAVSFTRLASSLNEGRTSGTPASDRVSPSADEFDAHDVLFDIRSNRVRSGIATFLYPGMARSLARLYVDTEPPMAADEAVYRFEFVDALGTPTGATLQGSVALAPADPAPAMNLEASNEAHVATLSWDYPKPDPTNYDGVGFFEVYAYPNGDGSAAERLNKYPVFRRGDISEYAYNFEVPFDTTITLAVEAVDIANQRTRTNMRFTPVDNIPPNQVQGVQAEADDREIRITWEPLDEPDIVGYRLYRSERVDSLAVWRPLHEKPLPSYADTFRDTTLTAFGAQTWFYHVVSIDEDGNEGPPSAAATGQIEDHEPPEPISDLVATYDPDADIVRLSWTDDPQAPDLETYSILRRRVRRGLLQLGVEVNRGNVTATSYDDEGPDGQFQEGATYRYSVAAVDGTRNSSERRSVLVEVPDDEPPAAPPRINAQAVEGHRIVLTWPSSPALDIGNYVLYRSDAGGEMEEIARLPASGLRFVDRDFDKGVQYAYTVEAVDRAGNAGERAPAATISVGDADAPRQVRGVRAVTAGSTGVDVTWEPVPDADLAGYRVWRMQISTGVPQPASDSLLPAGTTRFLDAEGAAGVFYQVTAYDEAGNHGLTSEPTEAIATP